MKTYADVFPQWRSALTRLPDYMQSAVERYVLHGIPPGHFLTAVVENNLREAVERADSTNIWFLREYVVFFYTSAPGECWGSPQRVKDWIGNSGALGLVEQPEEEDAE